jgi:hypothetical protein
VDDAFPEGVVFVSLAAIRAPAEETNLERLLTLNPERDGKKVVTCTLTNPL